MGLWKVRGVIVLRWVWKAKLSDGDTEALDREVVCTRFIVHMHGGLKEQRKILN